MALEKARRHAEDGEQALFLCYNRMLKEFLELNNQKYRDYIHFYSIDGFACMICKTAESNYGLLNRELQRIFMEDTFPYQHIIIDEGPDFGQDANTFNENDVMMYYVGSSRAKIELRIITTLDDEACILTKRFGYPEDKKIKAPKSKLADKLNVLRMKEQQ